MAVVQRDLERQLARLRRELHDSGTKLKNLQDRESEYQASGGGIKRRRSDGPGDLRDSGNKRLRSSGPGAERPNDTEEQPQGTTKEEPTEEKREVPKQGTEDKKRNRRLLGSLLMGTLASFKKQVDKESEVLQHRKEVEKQTEDKVHAEHQQFLEEQRKRRLEDITSLKSRVSRIEKDILSKEEEVLKLKSAAHAEQLGFFLKTSNVVPAIYYFPVKCDEFTERVLGTKPLPPIVEIKLPLQQENQRDGGQEGGNKGKSRDSGNSIHITTTTTTTSTTTTVKDGVRESDGTATDSKTDGATGNKEKEQQEQVPVEEAPKKVDEDQPTHHYHDDDDEKEDKKKKEKKNEKQEKVDDDELADGVTPSS